MPLLIQKVGPPSITTSRLQYSTRLPVMFPDASLQIRAASIVLLRPVFSLNTCPSPVVSAASSSQHAHTHLVLSALSCASLFQPPPPRPSLSLGGRNPRFQILRQASQYRLPELWIVGVVTGISSFVMPVPPRLAECSIPWFESEPILDEERRIKLLRCRDTTEVGSTRLIRNGPVICGGMVRYVCVCVCLGGLGGGGGIYQADG